MQRTAEMEPLIPDSKRNQYCEYLMLFECIKQESENGNLQDPRSGRLVPVRKLVEAYINANKTNNEDIFALAMITAFGENFTKRVMPAIQFSNSPLRKA